MDKEVALRDANRQFAQYVRAIEAGESFVITRHRRAQPVRSAFALADDLRPLLGLA